MRNALITISRVGRAWPDIGGLDDVPAGKARAAFVGPSVLLRIGSMNAKLHLMARGWCVLLFHGGDASSSETLCGCLRSSCAAAGIYVGPASLALRYVCLRALAGPPELPLDAAGRRRRLSDSMGEHQTPVHQRVSGGRWSYLAGFRGSSETSRAGCLASSLLGTSHTRRNGLVSPPRLHSPQPCQTRIGKGTA